MTDREILLTKMRRASLQLRLADASIEEAAVQLKHGWISVPGAIVILREHDVLSLVLPELDGLHNDTGETAA
jgi:hypothetical protein